MNNLRKKMCVVALLGIFGLVACTSESTEQVPVDEVPRAVMGAVEKTLPGITIEKASRQIKDKTMVYKLEGELASGEEYEIEITEAGTVIEVELED